MDRFFAFFDGNPQGGIINPLFGLYYWIGIMVAFLLVSSLFVCKRFYAKLSSTYSFRCSLGIFQLLLYVSFFLVHGLNGDGYHWTLYFPFQLCSVLNITSGILLLIPYKALFNITFPLIGPVILAFLLPDPEKWHFGPQHFLYWNFYLVHAIILFAYLYLYLYGHVSYNKIYLKKSILYITLFGCIVFIFNTIFDTNYLFIGPAGYSAKIGKGTFDTSVWLPILRFLFMYIVGLILLLLTYVCVINKLVPFYLEKGSKINPAYENKKKLHQKIAALTKKICASKMKMK